MDLTIVAIKSRHVGEERTHILQYSGDFEFEIGDSQKNQKLLHFLFVVQRVDIALEIAKDNESKESLLWAIKINGIGLESSDKFI